MQSPAPSSKPACAPFSLAEEQSEADRVAVEETVPRNARMREPKTAQLALAIASITSSIMPMFVKKDESGARVQRERSGDLAGGRFLTSATGSKADVWILNEERFIRQYEPTDLVRPRRSYSDADLLCIGAAISLVDSGLRFRVPFGVGLWVLAGRLAIWRG